MQSFSVIRLQVIFALPPDLYHTKWCILPPHVKQQVLLIPGIASFCQQELTPQLKPSEQKQLSADFIPKHTQCSNVTDKLRQRSKVLLKQLINLFKPKYKSCFCQTWLQISKLVTKSVEI